MTNNILAVMEITNEPISMMECKRQDELSSFEYVISAEAGKVYLTIEVQRG